MAIIRVCNYFISTNYKKSEAKEKFEEALTSFVEDFDKDMSFELALFIESLTEDGEDFEMLSDIDDDESELEYSEEDIDVLVNKLLNAYVDEDDDFEVMDEEEGEDE